MTTIPDVTVVITSCNRHDLLEHTLATFLAYNTYQGIKEIIVVEDGETDPSEICRKYGARLIHISPQRGQVHAIDIAYTEVTTPYIFHCEDDWEFYNSGFIEKSKAVLQSDQSCVCVWLRAWDDTNGHPLSFISPDETYGVLGFDYGDVWHGFSWNPGLRRKADYDTVGPFSIIFNNKTNLDEPALSGVYKKLGYHALILDKAGYVRHTGWERHIFEILENERYHLRTNHNTLIYADIATMSLKHAPESQSPANLFVEVNGHESRLMLVHQSFPMPRQISFQPMDVKSLPGIEVARFVFSDENAAYDWQTSLMPDGLITLFSNENYLSADLDGFIRNDRSHCREWERFELIKIEPNTNLEENAVKNTGKFAAVAMVKNECDIIELFLKINLRVFDFIYVLDHMSDDGTTEIIKKLQDLLYPIGYQRISEFEYNQSSITTSAVQNVARQNIFDHIMTLDADEFLISDDGLTNPRDTIAGLLKKNEFGLVPMRTYFPFLNNFYSSTAPLYENFLQRADEPNLFNKVVLGNEFAKDGHIFMGNHMAHNDRFLEPPVMLPLTVQHVPVRSGQQIIRKAILGSYSLSLKQDRKQGEGFHWDVIANAVRELNFQIDHDALAKIARNYMLFNQELDLTKISENAPKIGTYDDLIEFKELALINPIKSFDSFIASLLIRLNQ